MDGECALRFLGRPFSSIRIPCSDVKSNYRKQILSFSWSFWMPDIKTIFNCEISTLRCARSDGIFFRYDLQENDYFSINGAWNTCFPVSMALLKTVYALIGEILCDGARVPWWAFHRSFSILPNAGHFCAFSGAQPPVRHGSGSGWIFPGFLMTPAGNLPEQPGGVPPAAV